jgi:uncharacterized membrane protein YjgN (DUF898 family)
MSEASAAAREGRVQFTGSRHELLAIIIGGYALMLPTIGLYRFWQATWKRRFYWQNTVIDGEPLEYTGTATQLQFGFFFALAIFVPIYIVLFAISMEESRLLALGYVGVAALVWFLMGYAIYRARDFRLSRTLWRGIRFDQRGSALAYGARRFLWSIVMVPTLGLVYPWMASSLWKYRWRNTWFGDRKFEIAGNWRAFAGRFYATYLANLLAIGATIGWIASSHDYSLLDGVAVPGPLGWLCCLGCVAVLGVTLAWYRAGTASRMLSTVSLDEARLTVHIAPGRLMLQYLIYVAGVVALLALLAVTVAAAIGGIVAAATAAGKGMDAAALASMFQSGPLNVILLIFVYLVVLGAFGLLWEIVLGLGWWKLLAAGARIANPESLRAVRAAPEDRSLIGQGLADALNVGAY